MADGPWVIRCPTCGDTYWKRPEQRILENDVYIETNQPHDGAVFAEFSDEEELEPVSRGPWKCDNGHTATPEIAARLEELR